MSFWAVVFVVLMILALFGSWWAYYPGPGRPVWAPAGGFFLLWLCLAILGYIVLAAPTVVVR
jgi:uncharacterized membrane protein